MNTLNFKIQGQHTLTTGVAAVVAMYAVGKTMAISYFEEMGDERTVKISGVGHCQDHTVYECYTDSGSDDYYYFAVKSL